MDFTLTTYRRLLTTLQTGGYTFQPFRDYLQHPAQKTVILRHDVDKLPENALKMAQLEHSLGVHSTYFFRTVNKVWDEQSIGQIAEMGHEIGYHYENLSATNGNYEKAIADFETQLEKLRRLYPVQTICVHGSPLSKWDSKMLWEYPQGAGQVYDYRAYGILGEPYFDIDYNEVFYLTDTGRQWNIAGASVRDKVASGFSISVKSTSHIMELALENRLPEKIMLNTHPQRWFEPGPGWLKELVMQNIKNVAKRVVVLTGVWK